MNEKLLVFFNVLVTSAAIYLAEVHLELCIWWKRLYSDQAPLLDYHSTFASHADQMRIVAIMILITNLLSAIVLRKAAFISWPLFLIAVSIASLGLLLCLLVVV